MATGGVNDSPLPAPDDAPQGDGGEARAPRLVRRVLWALLPLAGIIAAVRGSGVVSHLDVEGLRAHLQGLGGWAVVPFVFLYGLGVVAHIPGSLFVGASVLAYGPVGGGLASYAGALWGNVLSFGLVRMTGYRPLRSVRWPVLVALMRRLDRRPVSAVTLIRVVFPTTAPVNYVLALSGVAWSPYVVGSMVGVLPQLIATVGLFGAIF